MHTFEDRIDEITEKLIHAAENVGFFILVNHGPSKQNIESMFAKSRCFFSLPDEVKVIVPWTLSNIGWEKNSQVRPSTG
jgi:isopenicillin N synthase-like dioxygenase